MKKVIIAIILFSFPSILLSQENELTEKQLKQFNRSKVSIEILTGSFGSYNQQTGIVSTSDWRRWQAYEGFTKISEPYFFSLTGYEFEAQQAKKYHTTSNILLWSGVSLSVIGTIVAIAGYSRFNQAPLDSQEEQSGETILWVGTGILIAGLFPLSFGFDRHNWAPVGKAADIKNEYNEKLSKNITKE